LPVVALALGFAGPAQAQNDKQQEVKLIHVLLVMDSSDPVLDRGVRRDQRNITKLLDDHIPKNRYNLKVLSGTAITSDQIISYYKNLKVEPGEGLLFYYSGHGAIVEGKGHTLEIQKGKQALRRSDLIKAMTEKKAALTVVLTDCCSDRLSYADERVLAEGKDRAGLPLADPTPLVRKLLFQSRGLVDITAATNDVALADDNQGGYFTKALCRIADTKKDDTLGWKDFFAAVSKETGVIHKDAVTRGTVTLPAGAKLNLQIPTAFAIAVESIPAKPDTQPKPELKTDAVRVAAIIGLTNSAAEEIEVQYRWDASHTWVKKKIPAGKSISIGTVLPPSMTKTPPLLVRLNGQDQTLEATRFDLPRAPKPTDAKMYNLGEKKDGGKGSSRSFELVPNPTTDPTPDPVVLEGESLPPPPVGSKVIER